MALMGGVVAYGQPMKQINYTEVGSDLPPIRIRDRAGIEYTAADITEDRYFFMVLFNPTCGHCVDAAKLIMEHQKEFEENTIMFIATESMQEHLAPFVRESEWTDNVDRILGTASDAFIREVYNFGSLPQINVYNKERKLVKVFNGDVSMDDLRPYIK